MQTTTNPLILFLIECFQRLTVKSPKFFKVWKIITGIPVLIIALPNALEQFNIHAPQLLHGYIESAVSWATTGAFIMAFFTTQSKATTTDQNGTPIKQTDTIKLPFTAQAEQKEVKKLVDDTDILVTKVNIPNPVKPVLNEKGSLDINH